MQARIQAVAHPPPLRKKKDWRHWTDNLYSNVYLFWLYVYNIVSVLSFFAIIFISYYMYRCNVILINKI